MLKVGFVDFWPGFQPENCRLFSKLKRRFNCEVSENPDLLFCGPFIGNLNYLRYNCPKILISGENLEKRFHNIRVPDYDLAFLCHHPKHKNAYYIPYTLTEKKFERLQTSKTKFACYVVGNSQSGDGTGPRTKLFLEILARAAQENLQVDSAGSHLNNTGSKAPRSEDDRCSVDPLWLSQYKFNICGENSYTPGYFTEKIYQAHLAGCIPVYLTHPENFKYLNQKAGIFGTCEADVPGMVERAFSLTEEQRQEMLAEAPFLFDPKPYLELEEELTLKLVASIFNKPKKIYSLFPIYSELEVIWNLNWKELVKTMIDTKEEKYLLALDKLAQEIPVNQLNLHDADVLSIRPLVTGKIPMGSSISQRKERSQKLF